MKDVLNKLGLNTKLYSRDRKFSTKKSIVKFHPSKGTHWVVYLNDICFDTYGCTPPKYYPISSKKGWKICFFFLNKKIQGIDSYCAA